MKDKPIVSDVMVSEMVNIESSASIVDAARQMIGEEKGTLPVTEGDRLHAMITDRDVIAHVVAEGHDPSSTTMHDVATTHELVTIAPDQDVEEARRLMDQHYLDRILMVQDERLVGIISEADLRSDEGTLD